ncbi:MerR family transcriptional regulator [Kibdelosporangium phytohabitans]|uniref:MerR family transcriptional regulator n=1 Tax=Kibdelosporangium phytohabitans TaxID=860235 RepID=A0A0N9ICH1_9PSEU|nr:MerR family transcriptional regulator [Kibdelosporangium phytohabitans]ALG14121.1 MerR family transcriptional regulator [Kibdelosporangium phytohabitans]MBE1466896.1 DNA-binding transcriptional MerR regulator [Kibdelosporangium phytohabitans]
MLIGELATRAGTTIRALRYYEQQHLLHPRRTSNGYRDYDESALVRVANIRQLLSMGLTANDIREFLPCLDQEMKHGPVCAESTEIITGRLVAVEEKIAALDAVRARLTEALARAD